MSREQRDQIVNNIHNETLRLNSLASSFLDLARLESGRVQFRKTRFSVADLLYECRDVMMTKAQETNVQIRVDVPDDMPLMEADRDKIKQVVLNLISNAIKYNRPNGSVIITGNFDETNNPLSFRIRAWESQKNPSPISLKSFIGCVSMRTKPQAPGWDSRSANKLFRDIMVASRSRARWAWAHHLPFISPRDTHHPAQQFVIALESDSLLSIMQEPPLRGVLHSIDYGSTNTLSTPVSAARSNAFKASLI